MAQHIFSPGERVRDMEDGQLGVVVVAPPAYRASLMRCDRGRMLNDATGTDSSGRYETTVQFDGVTVDGVPCPSWRYSHMLELLPDNLFSEVK